MVTTAGHSPAPGGPQPVIVTDGPRISDKELRTNVSLLYYDELGHDSKLSLSANHLIRGRRFSKTSASFFCRLVFAIEIDPGRGDSARRF